MEKKRTTIVTDIVSANWGMVKQQRYQVIILPWGAMEPHNYHLPYLTDCILSYETARDCAKAALKQGVKCMVLPAIYMGSQNIGQWNKPFCVHARSETQEAILLDMITSFYGQRFRNMDGLPSGHPRKRIPSGPPSLGPPCPCVRKERKNKESHAKKRKITAKFLIKFKVSRR